MADAEGLAIAATFDRENYDAVGVIIAAAMRRASELGAAVQPGRNVQWLRHEHLTIDSRVYRRDEYSRPFSIKGSDVKVSDKSMCEQILSREARQQAAKIRVQEPGQCGYGVTYGANRLTLNDDQDVCLGYGRPEARRQRLPFLYWVLAIVMVSINLFDFEDE